MVKQCEVMTNNCKVINFTQQLCAECLPSRFHRCLSLISTHPAKIATRRIRANTTMIPTSPAPMVCTGMSNGASNPKQEYNHEVHISFYILQKIEFDL